MGPPCAGQGGAHHRHLRPAGAHARGPPAGRLLSRAPVAGQHMADAASLSILFRGASSLLSAGPEQVGMVTAGLGNHKAYQC